MNKMKVVVSAFLSFVCINANSQQAMPKWAASGDLTGNYPGPAVATVNGVPAASIASGATAANAATSANTPSTIVKRDSSGNFSAGTITATLNGNASSATTAGTLTTPIIANSVLGNTTGSPAAPVASTNPSVNSITVSAATGVLFGANGSLISPSSGTFQLSNGAGGFGFLYLGDTTSASPAIKKTAGQAQIDFKLGDNSAYTSINALGGYFNGGSGSWVDSFLPGTYAGTNLESVSPTGRYGGFFATRLSDNTGQSGVTGAAGFLTVCDNSSTTHTCWGNYNEVDLMAANDSTRQAFGNETSVRTEKTFSATALATTVDPFSVNSGGWAHGLRVDCDRGGSIPPGGTTAQPCNGALEVLPNSQPFYAGLVFGSGSLSTAIYTNPKAISMPGGTNGYSIAWYGAAQTPRTEIISNSGSTYTKMNFGTNSVSFQDSAGNTNFSVSTGVGGQVTIGTSAGTNQGNSWQFQGRSSGQSVLLQLVGIDTNVGATFITKAQGGFIFKPGSDNASAFTIQNAGATLTPLTVDTTNNLVKLGALITLRPLTVSTLPTCNSTTQNGMAMVTDATAPTYNGTLTGGGTVSVPVFCNGTAWTSH